MEKLVGSDVLLGLCTAGGVQVLIFLPLTKKKVGALHIALSPRFSVAFIIQETVNNGNLFWELLRKPLEKPSCKPRNSHLLLCGH